MKTIISMLTMKKTESAFRDVVSGESVYFYKDRYGTLWLAAYPYYPFKFRVKSLVQSVKQKLNKL